MSTIALKLITRILLLLSLIGMTSAVFAFQEDSTPDAPTAPVIESAVQGEQPPADDLPAPNVESGTHATPPGSADDTPQLETQQIAPSDRSRAEFAFESRQVTAQNTPLTGIGQITGMTLINAENDTDAVQLPDNFVFDLDANPYPINIRAEVEGEVGSIVTVILVVEDGVPVNFFLTTDNTAPFTILNSPDDDIAGVFPPAGEYFISVIAYAGADGTGDQIGTEVFTLFVEGQVPINRPPNVPDRTLEVTRDSSTNFDIAEGASDPDGDTLTFDVLLAPQNGSVQQNGDTYTYTPNPGYIGTDTFIVRGDDGEFADTGIVTVTVIQPVGLQVQIIDLTVIDAENDADLFPLTEGLRINRNLLEMPASVRATATENTVSVSFSLVIDEGDGAPTQINYPPNNGVPFTMLGENGESDYLGALAPVGEYTLTVTPFSGPDGTGEAGETFVRTFSVVDPTMNEPPLALPERLDTFTETTVAFSPAAWVTNTENEPLIYELATPPANGRAEGSRNGLDASYTPAAGFVGTDSFVINVLDGVNTVPMVVTVDVIQPPQVETTAIIDAASGATIVELTEGIIVDRLQLGSEIDLAATIAGTVNSATFTVEVPNPDGSTDTFNYPPDNTAPFTALGSVGGAFDGVNAPLGGYTLIVTPYTEADGGGLVGTPLVRSFTIVDSRLPQPPTLPDQTLTTAVNQSVAFDISAGAADLNNDPLTFSVATPPQNGTVTGDVPNLLYTPQQGFIGTDTFEIAASDGTFTTVATVTVTVEAPPPDAPTVLKFVLVDTDTGNDLFDIQNGSLIDLSVVGTQLSVRAEVNEAVTSVVFEGNLAKKANVVGGEDRFLENVTLDSVLENVPPYAINGDIAGRYRPWDIQQGEYTLTATPYTGRNATGVAGSSLSVSFEFVNNGALPQIERFVLISIDEQATGDEHEIEYDIAAGALFPESLIGDTINIRAEANDQTDNVILQLFDASGNLVATRNEKVAPFALFGDSNGDYNSGTLEPGAYSLRATALSDAKNSAEWALIVDFVIGSD